MRLLPEIAAEILAERSWLFATPASRVLALF